VQLPNFTSTSGFVTLLDVTSSSKDEIETKYTESASTSHLVKFSYQRISRTSGCLGMSDKWESVNSRGETGWRAGGGRFLPPR